LRVFENNVQPLELANILKKNHETVVEYGIFGSELKQLLNMGYLVAS